MKKIIIMSVILCLVLLAALTGCGKEEPNASNEVSAANEASQSEPSILTGPIPELDLDEYKKLNLFLSNFAEVNWFDGYYSANSGSEESASMSITGFAIQHVFPNNQKSVSKLEQNADSYCFTIGEGDSGIDCYYVYSIDVSLVDAAIAKYTVEKKTGANSADGAFTDFLPFERRDGKYYFSFSERDSRVTRWAQVEGMTNNGDGTYNAVYRVYFTDGALPQNRYEPKENWDSSSVLSKEKWTATIKPEENNGESGWVLLKLTQG